MARRRYQAGSVKFVNRKFIGRWREDVILPDGTVKRLNRKRVLGTKEDFKTKREAQRAMDQILAPINSLDYRPTHQVTFPDFGARWLEKVLPTYKQGGSQSTARRQVRRLIAVFGSLDLGDISTEVLQSLVAALLKKGNSAKYIRNIVSMASAMWSTALAWNYVTHKPFEGLILPQLVKPNADAYSPEEVIAIFGAACEPFRTFLWIAGECGMRPAEVCGLDALYVHLADRVISVRQSESMGRIVTPKTQAGYRDFAISQELAEHLQSFLNGKREGLLFMSPNGRPWRETKVVEKRLNPLLKKLGIAPKGLKAFRHFNATMMDAKNVPVKTRQTRLGHDDPRITLGMKNRSGYTHMVGDDDRKVAAMFGAMFGRVLCPDVSKPEEGRTQQILGTV